MGSAIFISKGDTVNYTPVADVAKGTVVKLGSFIGVTILDILANQLGSLYVGGNFYIKRKTGDVFTQGDRVYFDLVTQEATVDTSKQFIGIYFADDIHDISFIVVRMNEFFGLVDTTDFLEYANVASFPVTGSTGVLYVALDTEKVYRWTGSIYIEVSPTTGGGGTWGSITGTLSSQTDLQTALDARLSVTLTAPANDDFIQRKAGVFVNRTVAQVQTDLGIASLSDIAFTQPSASTSWVLVHGRAIKPNFAYFNASGQREIPLEDASVAGQVTLTFGASEIHTATLPGNGTSASIRNDNIISILASAINTASGVIDIVTARTINVIMDANITFAITFSTTPADGVPLTLAFIKTTPLYTAVPLDVAKFKGSVSNPMPAPFITATLNTKDTLDFRYYANKSKMSLTGADLGA